mmetsp:Transcript_24306/g.54084  ORF Transcript_24306/g.54084 Transcript_24306/m.54084 type:complete len:428 (-) Transcript_24306:85-1368(-)
MSYEAEICCRLQAARLANLSTLPPADVAALLPTEEVPPHALSLGITGGWTLAHAAAIEGDLKCLRLLDHFAESRELLWAAAATEDKPCRRRNINRMPALHTPARCAAIVGNADVVRHFAEHSQERVRATVWHSENFRALALEAVENGHLAVLQYLAEMTNETRRSLWSMSYGMRGRSLAFLAALHGHTSVFRFLLERSTAKQRGVLISSLLCLRNSKDIDMLWQVACEKPEVLNLVLAVYDELSVDAEIEGFGNISKSWDLRGGPDWLFVRAIREGATGILRAFLALRPAMARSIFHSTLYDEELNLEGNVAHLAAARGRRDVVHILAEHDSKIDAQELFSVRSLCGSTAEELARAAGHEALALFLRTAMSAEQGPSVALEKYLAGWRDRVLRVAYFAMLGAVAETQGTLSPVAFSGHTSASPAPGP